MTLENELKEAILGDVHFDEMTRTIYSVDASIFEIKPLAVIIPKDKDDLQRAVCIASKSHIPITARGAATGITGGCLGHGIVIDLSQSLNRILEIDPNEKCAVCEPGVIQDELNLAADKYNLRLGPDTSTGNRATLGGMLANNAAGARSLHYGTMSEHIEEVELLLASGAFIKFSTLSLGEWEKKRAQNDEEGNIYRILWKIKEKYSEEIRAHFPKIPRRVSGYNVDTLLKHPFNVAKMIAGSEGTLGIITEMKVRLVPKLRTTALLLIFFDDLLDAFKRVPSLLSTKPTSLELIDRQIIELGRDSPTLRKKLDWLQGNPQALLIVEYEGKDGDEVKQKIHEIEPTIGYHQLPLFDLSEMAKVWDLRKAGLGILLSKRSYSRAIAFLEDLSIPPHHLPLFMEKFCAYLASKGKEAGIYGHVGAGCMHIRPFINLRDPKECALMRQMMIDVSSLVLEFGGALSGEHGDGWIRSWLNPKMFGEKIMEAFRLLKGAFDPSNLMNPGKIIPLSDDWEEMRTQPDVPQQTIKPFLDFEAEGGFELAADLCNGNGLCRKKEKVMCPSFQVTNNEFHSTRARAQALRAIIHKKLPLEALTSQEMYDVMDLCISCKGCKTECPSQVDMAKFKSEFLYHYQEKHGYPLRNVLFSQIAKLNQFSSHFPSFFNWLMNKKMTKALLEKIGISPKRSMPAMAKQPFSTWFKGYLQEGDLKKRVLLFDDTFTEFHDPEIGQAAVKVLNALGFYVLLLPNSCCGRPALSKGMLKTARKQANLLIERLWPYAQYGDPIIGVEPSCLLTLKDDYASLIDNNKLSMIQSKCVTFDEFIAQNISEEIFQKTERVIKVHGHCHQKSLVGMKPTLDLLKAIPGFQVEEIPSGCCGMAGSFGYEKEHADISMQIGELHLFPAVRKSPKEAWIIANGISCRHQIKDGTGREAIHLAIALERQLNT